MTTLDRRSLLLALSATALTGCGVGALKMDRQQTLLTDIDMKALSEIARSYFEATQDKVSNGFVKRFFADGRANVDALNAAITKDFKNQHIFTHKGWHLSHTEGKLMTAISRAG